MHIDQYLDELAKDIYPQPVDEGHVAWAIDAVLSLCPMDEIENVLDVGCGEGFASVIFEESGKKWTGVTLGDNDYKKAKSLSKEVYKDDVTFLKFENDSFDLIFARHILEHSAMQLLTLMEWHRVGKKYLLLIYPAWEFWLSYGKNHYQMQTKEQLWWTLSRAGWKIEKQADLMTSDDVFMEFFMKNHPEEERVWHGHPVPVEYRYLCKKGEPQRE